MPKKLYIASPYGFSEAGNFFLYSRFLTTIEDAGFDILDPWKLIDPTIIDRVSKLPPGPDKVLAQKQVNHLIYLKNRAAIQESDGLVAVLDGTDVDSGVASEIGCASTLGKKILGYRGDFRKTGENEGCIVDLQVQGFIEANGGRIITRLDQLKPALIEIFR